MANPKTKNILISMMIAMSSAFLIGSILLLSRDAYAASDSDGKSYQYTGYADTREVVSEAVFVKSGSLTAEVGKIVVEDGGVTRITSGAVVSERNTGVVNRMENSNVLGGTSNIVGTSSKVGNITLLGGSGNSANGYNVMLGGSGNSTNISQSTIIGGMGNKSLPSSSGGFILGGFGNMINNRGYGFILGGSGNKNYYLKNSVVAGSSLSGLNNDVSNIFVFSNTSNFAPQTSNTFYINATNGLGINGASVKSGVNVHGIVKVGLVACDNNNLGAIGMASNGCLVGCKKNSSGSHKWHLIDKSKTCQDWCQENSSSCETTSSADTTRKLGEGACTGEVAANPSYTPCSKAEDRAKSLTGVSFISYFTPACPKQNEPYMVNPCAYTCRSGYKAQKTSGGVRECKR